jgi:hypothetical protein
MGVAGQAAGGLPADRPRPNAKDRQLIAALPRALDEIAAKGGGRKAVIFTESVRTQRYLSDLLSANGYAGQIALLNGQNADAESRAIYEDWMVRHKGTDAISGSRSADMKAAIVEAFKTRKPILTPPVYAAALPRSPE